MDSTQPMNYNQMMNMLNNMGNNNMMMNNMNMNQFNQMMNYMQMMNNQNNMMNMNNNPMMNMMMQMMNNQNMMNMPMNNNMMNNFDMNQYMLIFNQLMNNFVNYMKNNNNKPASNTNMINLIFIVNSDGNERKYTIPAEPNDTLSVIIGRYITKTGDSRVNYYIFAGERLNESLTVRQQGLMNGSIIYVVGVQNILGAKNV